MMRRSGADSLESRPGFAAMLERIEANGCKTILVETASRFAGDLMVQEVGYARLQERSIELIAVDSPGSFQDDGPTAKLVRQVLGAVPQWHFPRLYGVSTSARYHRSLSKGLRHTVMRLASLRSKLTTTFVLAALMLVTVSVTSLVLLRAVNGVASDVRTLWLPKVEQLAKIRGILDQHGLLAAKTVTTGQYRFLTASTQSVEATGVALRAEEEAAHAQTKTWQEKLLITQFYDDWKVYEESLEPILRHLDIGELRQAAGLYKSHAHIAFRQASNRFQQLIALSNEGSAAAVRQGEEIYAFAFMLTAILVIATVFFAGGAIMWVGRNIRDPILRVSAAMQALARGNLDVQTHECQRHDEIGTLFKAVLGYRDALVSQGRMAQMAERERERLKAAVSHLPVGMAMFDENKQLIICNARYRELYNVPDELAVPGVALAAMLQQRIATGNFEGDRETYIERVMQIVENREPSLRQVALADGRIVSISQQPVDGVGWVATHQDVTERVRATDLVTQLARHDALTGLPNRTAFSERVNEVLSQAAEGGSVAVLYLDLDRFKQVNDTLGHPIGDALLKIVASRLKTGVRGTDFVARLGGDEFAIVQTDCSQPESSRILAERLIESVGRPYVVEGHDIVIGTSVGIAMAPSDGRSAEVLLKLADLALYNSKKSGRGQAKFYHAELTTTALDRQRLEVDLRVALASSNLEVYYQPIVATGTGKIVCFEALLRWNHPKRGPIAPDVFIPLAEQMGLICQLGEWVLQRACRDAASWPEGISVAVNVSPAQFTSAKLIETVTGALQAAELSPRRLELEITENLLLSGREAALAVLQQLRALGVRIAMDDFGCGFSSLNYLRSFPFDTIKIDKSFVQSLTTDPTSRAIVRAVIRLSDELGATATAEGVETQAQLAVLEAEGCAQAQGFLFSPALASPQAQALVRHARPLTAHRAAIEEPGELCGATG